MYRRPREDLLPREPLFPTGRVNVAAQPTLKELGFKVERSGKIRTISAPPRYFYPKQYGRNMHWNDRVVFDFRQAVQDVIHKCLMVIGLTKILLPFEVDGPDEKHAPIFASEGLCDKSRVVVVFGQTNKDLGVLSYHAAQGPGGLGQASMVPFVRSLQRQPSSARDTTPPGIVLANMGQILWWPDLRRPVTLEGWRNAPRSTAVHHKKQLDSRFPDYYVKRNECPEAHVEYMFEEVLPRLLKRDTKLDIIAISESVEVVESYIDAHFKTWGSRLNTVTALGGFFKDSHITSPGYKAFKKNRGRVYIPHYEKTQVLISGPEGNSESAYFTNYGCHVFASGELWEPEKLLSAARKSLAQWIEDVALNDNYKHPVLVPVSTEPKYDSDIEGFWGNYTTEATLATEDVTFSWGAELVTVPDNGEGASNVPPKTDANSAGKGKGKAHDAGEGTSNSAANAMPTGDAEGDTSTVPNDGEGSNDSDPNVMPKCDTEQDATTVLDNGEGSNDVPPKTDAKSVAKAKATAKSKANDAGEGSSNSATNVMPKCNKEHDATNVPDDGEGSEDVLPKTDANLVGKGKARPDEDKAQQQGRKAESKTADKTVNDGNESEESEGGLELNLSLSRKTTKNIKGKTPYPRLRRPSKKAANKVREAFQLALQDRFKMRPQFWNTTRGIDGRLVGPPKELAALLERTKWYMKEADRIWKEHVDDFAVILMRKLKARQARWRKRHRRMRRVQLVYETWPWLRLEIQKSLLNKDSWFEDGEINGEKMLVWKAKDEPKKEPWVPKKRPSYLGKV